MNSRAFFVLAGALLWASCNKSNLPPPDQRPPGLFATPSELAFLCVTPGCDDTQPVEIDVVGSRAVAIDRIIIEGSTDFTLTASQKPPFIGAVGSNFTIQTEYIPHGAPIAQAINIAIDYTDASGTDSPDRLPPGRLLVPLVPRLVGEPILTVTPASLSFGAVDAGTRRPLSLHLENTGFGNIAVQIASVDAGSPDIVLGALTSNAFGPDAGTDLLVTFAPQGAEYVNTQIVITSSSTDIPPVVIPVEGTSLPAGQIALQPAGAVDFGQVPQSTQKSLAPELVNQGGRPLTITGITVQDPLGDLSASVGTGGPTMLGPLARVPLNLTVNAGDAGVLSATVAVSSNDPQRPVLIIPVDGLVTQPHLVLNPTSIDFGTVPVGWVVKQPLQLINTGYGLLTVKSITFVGGTSTLYTLNQLPGLPLTLDRNKLIGIEVDFGAQTPATFTGMVSVETDDPVNPFATVPLTATAGACGASCPIAHGTPSCQSGTCQIGMCNAGWFDTNNNPADGCECAAVGAAGSTCQNAIYEGQLDKEQDQSVTYNGNLPAGGTGDGAVDLIRFFATDQFNPFGNSFDVKVQLNSADPSIQMCVYRNDDGSHSDTCYFTNEVCPQSRYFEQGSQTFSNQAGDYIVKVYRTAGAPATCTGYTLYMENGN